MDVIHLGGNRLGERIRTVLVGDGEEVATVTDLVELQAALERRRFDWMVSAGFRHIVPPGLLEAVPDACNVHTSLLPWGRGAHPNVWMIVDGEPAGVTIHEMVPAVDAGPILAQRTVAVSFADDAKDLYQRLEDAAVELFDDVWPDLKAGRIQGRPQPEGGSHHRTGELDELADIDLDGTVTWRRALDVLRALTFPPHQNLVVEVNGRRYHVEIDVTALDDDDD